MSKATIFTLLFLFVTILDYAFSQQPHFILPTYRPPATRRPQTVRVKRNINTIGGEGSEHLWLLGDPDLNVVRANRLILPELPKKPDDTHFYPSIRTARSLDLPIIRIKKDENSEPLWLYDDPNLPKAPSSADHPILPDVIDDVKLDPNRRTARSLDSPSAHRHGGGGSGSSSKSSNTGPTHPGYNRRDSRDVRVPLHRVSVKLDPNRRTARSLDSPSAHRYGGGGSGSSSKSSDTGPTHPGYNRRDSRNIRVPLLRVSIRTTPSY